MLGFWKLLFRILRHFQATESELAMISWFVVAWLSKLVQLFLRLEQCRKLLLRHLPRHLLHAIPLRRAVPEEEEKIFFYILNWYWWSICATFNNFKLDVAARSRFCDLISLRSQSRDLFCNSLSLRLKTYLPLKIWVISNLEITFII